MYENTYLCKETIEPNDNIKLIAKDIIEHSNTKDKDALHLASAIYENCEYFINCDDKFIKTVEKNRDRLKDTIKNIKLYNPIDFLRKEMDIQVKILVRCLFYYLSLFLSTPGKRSILD